MATNPADRGNSPRPMIGQDFTLVSTGWVAPKPRDPAVKLVRAKPHQTPTPVPPLIAIPSTGGGENPVERIDPYAGSTLIYAGSTNDYSGAAV